jgi:hypothetical protein
MIRLQQNSLMLYLLLMYVNFQAQDTPAKWRLNMNAQDAYLVNNNLRFGAERIFARNISWSWFRSIG